MGAIIGLMAEFLLNFLLTVLPLSPFADMRLDGQVQTAVGWVNWIVPFGDMVAMMIAWITAATLVTVIGYVVDNIDRITDWLMGA